MTKTYCDKCGQEMKEEEFKYISLGAVLCPNSQLCNKCYQDLIRWLGLKVIGRIGPSAEVLEITKGEGEKE
jgi:uncharacterized OB-fold protein